MPLNTPLQRQIIKEWLKTKVVHPSHREIANKVNCSTETVFKIIKRYKSEKETKSYE